LASNFRDPDPIFGEIDLDDEYITNNWLVDQFVGNALYAWGDNQYGKLGNNTTTALSSPIQVGSLVNWSQISCGTYHTSAIHTDNSLWAWGLNTNGQLGTGDFNNYSSPVQIGGSISWKQVASGLAATVALGIDGSLWVWGSTQIGTITNRYNINVSSPVVVYPSSVYSWKSISAGGSHTMGITSAGLLYGWGYNTSGQLGINSTTNTSSPILVSGPAGASWTSVTTGVLHTMGITTAGLLYGWGYNGHGELGINSAVNKSSPVLVSGPTGASWNSIASAGPYNGGCTMGITTTGILYGWGLNDTGQLGINSTTNKSSPVLVSGPVGASWTSVTTGGQTTFGITKTGLIYGCGYNGNGQLGINSTINRSSPVLVSGPTGVSWTSVSAGFSHTMGITTTGLLYSWGDNFFGQIGINSSVSASSPVLVSGPAGTSWTSVSAGADHTMGITTAGLLYGWGYNNDGQIGINSTTSVGSPVLVSGPAGASWTSVSAGFLHTMGITTTGLLYGWGQNTAGQLGNLDTDITSPVQLTPGTVWKQVSTANYGYQHMITVGQDGSLWGWGNNSFNQVGSGLGVQVSSPTQIGSANTWKQVSAGYKYTLGIKLDGSLWAWGTDSYGELGGVTGSSPTQIGTLTNWKTAYGGHFFSAAVKTDGTLWVWGRNNYGQLGNNTTVNTSSPTQVGYLTTWKQVACGYGSILATKQDGTIWGWGMNNAGQLGNNSLAYYSSPIQIGSLSNWKQIATGMSHTVATTFTLNN
jgi:alpha-tubulin suppressor-like RCC1 family protein